MSPAAAREYIFYFRRYVMPEVKNAVTTDGTTISLDDMTDDEAIFVARELILWEKEALRRTPLG